MRAHLFIITIPLLLILVVPGEAKAGGTGRVIKACAKAGFCVFSLDAMTTWFPRLPPIVLGSGGALARMSYQREGSTFFPVGFALDMRLDSETVFVPFFGVMGAFAPGSSTTTDLGRHRVELGDLSYTAFLLPGLGVHAHNGDDRFRVSIAARAVYSAITLKGTTATTSVDQGATLEGRGVHGWGALASVELCRDIIGKRRGLCAFVQGTQAYSEGLQHAVTGGFRVVF